MGTAHPGRRQFLTAAGAGAVTAGLAGTASAAPPAGGHAVTGAWYITRKNTGQPGKARTVITFASGGVFVGADINPMSAPYLGSWAATGADTAEVTFWGAITDNKGRQLGTGRVRITAHVAGDTISGTYRGVIFADGQQQPGSGTFHGRRMPAD